MPNEPRNKTGRTLREQLRAAAKTTAEQQRARNSVSSDEKTRSSKARERAKDKKEESKGSGRISKRRASKEQVDDSKKRDREASKSKPKFIESAKDYLSNMSTLYRVLLLILVMIVVIGAILYPISRTYYQALRQEQKLQAELDAVNERNEAINAENKELETNEGIENAARQEYGWVKDDEHATVVINSDDNGHENDMPGQVDGSTIEAPHTWYYDILDVLFFTSV